MTADHLACLAPTVADAVRRLLAEAPPLSVGQRDAISALLRGPAEHAAAASLAAASLTLAGTESARSDSEDERRRAG